MAVSFPLDLIQEGEWFCSEFDLLSAQNAGQTGGGVFPVVQVGNDLWRGRYQTKVLSATRFDYYKALVHSLRGAMHPFLGWDCTRCRPIAYTGGVSLPGDIQGRLTDVSDLHLLTIDQVTAGFVVSPGDYLRINMNGNRYFYQVVDGATADGSGILTGIDVRPHLPANWEDNSTAVFSTPRCLMKVVPGSISMTRGQTGKGTISLEGIQVLKEPS